MPAQAPPLNDERSLLLAYVAQQRDGLRNAAFGLTDDQARATPCASSLSIGGLVKHGASVERGWMDIVLQRRAEEDDDFASRSRRYQDEFRLGPDETLAAAIAGYDEAAQATEAIIGGIDDLGQEVPVPKGVPWFPRDLKAWSVRWVLLHLVEETARHAGHADIIRETIDGATMYPLLAAVEGWPETDWLKPWKPAS
jgi:hypothetical protein